MAVFQVNLISARLLEYCSSFLLEENLRDSNEGNWKHWLQPGKVTQMASSFLQWTHRGTAVNYSHYAGSPTSVGLPQSYLHKQIFLCLFYLYWCFRFSQWIQNIYTHQIECVFLKCKSSLWWIKRVHTWADTCEVLYPFLDNTGRKWRARSQTTTPSSAFHFCQINSHRACKGQEDSSK